VSRVSPAITRLRIATALFGGVIVIGTVGYRLFGFSWVDAAYQTITTITTVGFREVNEFGTAEKWFTMVVIVTGVSTALYTLTLIMQVVVEGQFREFVGRRRMDKQIAQMRDHVIVCGWGRVGRSVAHELARSRRSVVVVDIDPDRLVDAPYPTIVGDVTLDATLRAAGVDRAQALVAALQGDAENLFVTLSSRAINPELFIVARARADESIDKLSRAGADRVVNPQELGAARMASFVVQPNVAEFVDVVMHERSMDLRMQEVGITAGSRLAGVSLRDANLRREAGVLVLAVRGDDGRFTANPDPDLVIHAGNVIIAVGTDDALELLEKVCA
jgi:voltage-gated potassium channel